MAGETQKALRELKYGDPLIWHRIMKNAVTNRHHRRDGEQNGVVYDEHLDGHRHGEGEAIFQALQIGTRFRRLITSCHMVRIKREF